MHPSAKVATSSRRAFLLLPVAGVAVALFATNSRRPAIREVDVAEGKAMLDAGALIVDVREAAQFKHRHIANALSLPLSVLEVAIPLSFGYAKTQPMLVYCGDGVAHGPEGTAILNRAGYANAVNLAPGLEGWASAGLPVAA